MIPLFFLLVNYHAKIKKQNITKKSLAFFFQLKKVNKFDKISTILLYIQKKYGILYFGLKGNFEKMSN